MALYCSVAACGGTPFRGVVETMPSRTHGGAYVPSRPLAGARIDLVCGPGRRTIATFTSDQTGILDTELGDDVQNGCYIEVTRAGYATRRLRVIDACAIGRQSRCSGIGFVARLLPEQRP